ncbi:histidine kinase [Hymenobacter sp.]|uniref:sensor histidine kinase n=1 Tax=Hymenobacter sp. TaxID=1898978 RepID=UPI00286A897D|nr:histidine kinase [Hymenobacter sp.]
MNLTQRRNWLLHVAVWSALFVAYLPFFLNNHIGQPLERDALGLGLLLLLYYGNARVLMPRLLARPGPGAYLLAALALGGGVSALRLGLDAALFGADMATGFPSLNRYRLYVLLLHGLVLGVSYFVTALRRREAEARRAQATISQQQQAQLLYLRSQINPHFLFNTLNNLYALTVARAPEAPEMVLRLAALLRYAIYSTREARVPVLQEVEHIRELLWLYQVRFEHPVPITLAVDCPAPGPDIEPMLLIPLVENCLKHGDLDYNPAGYVRLRLQVTATELVFETENTKDAADQPKDAAHGVGLDNIRQRLRLTHGAARAALLTLATPTTFTARLHLPLLPHAEDSHPAR